MKNYDCKHLTTTQRIKIEKGLLDGESFASITRKIEKHPSTVAKEVKKYRYFPEHENPNKKLPCIRKSNCAMRFLCDKKDCIRLCKLCYLPSHEASCMEICPDYIEKVCPKIQKAPYVCVSV